MGTLLSERGFLGFCGGWTFRPLKRMGFGVGCWGGVNWEMSDLVYMGVNTMILLGYDARI